MSRAWQLFVCALVSGCDQSPRSPHLDEIPEYVRIEAGGLSVGFLSGRTRVSQTLKTFQVTKAPITVGRYQQCVAVGACTPPANQSIACVEEQPVGRGPTWGKDPELPVTCVTPKQANAYCKWLGAKLPTLAQWMLATRGGPVQRFAWSNDVATCEQNPFGCDAADFRVGRHPKGASASGLVDALLTPAELIAPDPTTPYAACMSSTCMVTGASPGAIDTVAPAFEVTKGANESAMPTYGFRCAFEVTQ